MLNKPNFDKDALASIERNLIQATAKVGVAVLGLLKEEFSSLNPILIKALRSKLHCGINDILDVDIIEQIQLGFCNFDDNNIYVDGIDEEIFYDDETEMLNNELGTEYTNNQLSIALGLFIICNEELNQVTEVTYNVDELKSEKAFYTSFETKSESLHIDINLHLKKGVPKVSISYDIGEISSDNISSLLKHFDIKLSNLLLDHSVINSQQTVAYEVPTQQLGSVAFLGNCRLHTHGLGYPDHDSREFEERLSFCAQNGGSICESISNLVKRSDSISGFIESSGSTENYSGELLAYNHSILCDEYAPLLLKFGFEPDVDDIEDILDKLSVLASLPGCTLNSVAILTTELSNRYFRGKEVGEYPDEYIKLVEHPVFIGTEQLQNNFKDKMDLIEDYRSSLMLSNHIDNIVATNNSVEDELHEDCVYAPSKNSL